MLVNCHANAAFGITISVLNYGGVLISEVQISEIPLYILTKCAMHNMFAMLHNNGGINHAGHLYT